MVIGLAGVPATAYLARLFIPLAGWAGVWFLYGDPSECYFRFSQSAWRNRRAEYENHGRYKEADEALERMKPASHKILDHSLQCLIFASRYQVGASVIRSF